MFSFATGRMGAMLGGDGPPAVGSAALALDFTDRLDRSEVQTLDANFVTQSYRAGAPRAIIGRYQMRPLWVGTVELVTLDFATPAYTIQRKAW